MQCLNSKLYELPDPPLLPDTIKRLADGRIKYSVELDKCEEVVDTAGKPVIVKIPRNAQVGAGIEQFLFNRSIQLRKVKDRDDFLYTLRRASKWWVEKKHLNHLKTMFSVPGKPNEPIIDAYLEGYMCEIKMAEYGVTWPRNLAYRPGKHKKPAPVPHLSWGGSLHQSSTLKKHNGYYLLARWYPSKVRKPHKVYKMYVCEARKVNNNKF